MPFLKSFSLKYQSFKQAPEDLTLLITRFQTSQTVKKHLKLLRSSHLYDVNSTHASPLLMACCESTSVKLHISNQQPGLQTINTLTHYFGKHGRNINIKLLTQDLWIGYYQTKAIFSQIRQKSLNCLEIYIKIFSNYDLQKSRSYELYMAWDSLFLSFRPKYLHALEIKPTMQFLFQIRNGWNTFDKIKLLKRLKFSEPNIIKEPCVFRDSSRSFLQFSKFADLQIVILGIDMFTVGCFERLLDKNRGIRYLHLQFLMHNEVTQHEGFPILQKVIGQIFSLERLEYLQLQSKSQYRLPMIDFNNIGKCTSLKTLILTTITIQNCYVVNLTQLGSKLVGIEQLQIIKIQTYYVFLDFKQFINFTCQKLINLFELDLEFRTNDKIKIPSGLFQWSANKTKLKILKVSFLEEPHYIGLQFIHQFPLTILLESILMIPQLQELSITIMNSKSELFTDSFSSFFERVRLKSISIQIGSVFFKTSELRKIVGRVLISGLNYFKLSAIFSSKNFNELIECRQRISEYERLKKRNQTFLIEDRLFEKNSKLF